MDEETYRIIGAAMEVHKELGPGMLEKAYGDALVIEFGLRNIPFRREKDMTINYKGHLLDSHYYCDFLCYDDVIVELKTVENLLPIHRAQLFH